MYFEEKEHRSFILFIVKPINKKITILAKVNLVNGVLNKNIN